MLDRPNRKRGRVALIAPVPIAPNESTPTPNTPLHPHTGLHGAARHLLHQLNQHPGGRQRPGGRPDFCHRVRGCARGRAQRRGRRRGAGAARKACMPPRRRAPAPCCPAGEPQRLQRPDGHTPASRPAHRLQPLPPCPAPPQSSSTTCTCWRGLLPKRPRCATATCSQPTSCCHWRATTLALLAFNWYPAQVGAWQRVGKRCSHRVGPGIPPRGIAAALARGVSGGAPSACTPLLPSPAHTARCLWATLSPTSPAWRWRWRASWATSRRRCSCSSSPRRVWGSLEGLLVVRLPPWPSPVAPARSPPATWRRRARGRAPRHPRLPRSRPPCPPCPLLSSLPLPQIINFLYSVPQLFKLVPCPRHRLPRCAMAVRSGRGSGCGSGRAGVERCRLGGAPAEGSVRR